MYKKLLTLCVVAVISLSLAGCSKDAALNSTMGEIHALTEEIVKKIDASPTVAGVDEAQKLFDSKKSDLKEKWDDVKGARGFQVSEDTKKKFAESYVADLSSMKQIELKHIGVSMQNPAFKTKLEALVKDWEETFKLE
jgi:hypothetical protein